MLCCVHQYILHPFIILLMPNRFRTGRKLGYSLHLDGNKLVVETQSKIGKKPQANPVNFNLQFNKVNVSSSLATYTISSFILVVYGDYSVSSSHDPVQ